MADKKNDKKNDKKGLSPFLQAEKKKISKDVKKPGYKAPKQPRVQ